MATCTPRWFRLFISGGGFSHFRAFDVKDAREWMPVDIYIGGIEHGELKDVLS